MDSRYPQKIQFGNWETEDKPGPHHFWTHPIYMSYDSYDEDLVFATIITLFALQPQRSPAEFSEVISMVIYVILISCTSGELNDLCTYLVPWTTEDGIPRMVKVFVQVMVIRVTWVENCTV